jgi:hypothetical protein
MDVSNKFQLICIFFADEGFVSVLEQVAGAFVAEVEVNSITGKKSAHEGSETSLTRPQKKVCMVGKQRPGEAVGTGCNKKFRKTLKKSPSVGVIAEDVASVHTTDDYMLQKLRYIETGCSWHVLLIYILLAIVNN